jgi:tRNA-specific 2-thiouridylase
VRSTRPPLEAILHREGNDFFVDFPDGEEGVAPGQACVFYDSADPRGRVLGGGVIHSTLPMRESRAKMEPALQPEAALAV